MSEPWNTEDCVTMSDQNVRLSVITNRETSWSVCVFEPEVRMTGLTVWVLGTGTERLWMEPTQSDVYFLHLTENFPKSCHVWIKLGRSPDWDRDPESRLGLDTRGPGGFILYLMRNQKLVSSVVMTVRQHNLDKSRLARKKVMMTNWRKKDCDEVHKLKWSVKGWKVREIEWRVNMEKMKVK